MFKRILNINLPKGKSTFLWGPRKTGKSTYLKENFPNNLYYDFLNTDLYFELLKRPAYLRELILAEDKSLLTSPIIIDEVQKVPSVLEEVHWLIENKGLSFILCSSSAKKLKRGKANLLGERAWRFEMFPLISREVKNLDLLKTLNNGLIPSHYIESNSKRSLKAYVQDYLKEEIFAEGLIRNIPAFSRFFDVIRYSHGQLINYSNIARDTGVDSKTIREYFQILIDTLIGIFIEPFTLHPNRQIINKMPKFYLFDVGVAGSIQKRFIIEEKGTEFGNAFEHFILMELLAHRKYTELDYKIKYWRTKTGHEVDFILEDGLIAIEVKSQSRIDKKELRSIEQFCLDYKPRLAIVVTNEKYRRKVNNILLLPWKNFLNMLWEGDIIK